MKMMWVAFRSLVVDASTAGCIFSLSQCVAVEFCFFAFSFSCSLAFWRENEWSSAVACVDWTEI